MKESPAVLPVTRAVIDCASFRHNLAAVRSYVGASTAVMAVVKADAYGHGMEQIAAEALAAGAEFLAVARVHEGISLRQTGIEAPILVFEAAPEDHLIPALRAHLTLTVSTLAAAESLSGAAQVLGMTAAVHVKVDTGMGRLGFPAQSAAGAIRHIAGLRALTVEGVYSHFATSDDEDLSFAHRQLELFDRTVKNAERLGVAIRWKHIANSGAIIALPESRYDLVRPGIMLYGYPPRDGMLQRYPLRPVMSLVSRIAFLKTIDAGTSVSYGRKYVASRWTRIATVPIGYADGYSRLLTNRMDALVKGTRYPVVGAICMDQCMLDIGPDGDAAVGDEVVLFGSSGAEAITAQDIARVIGTIPYEVTCLVTRRVPRVFRHPAAKI